MGEVIRFVGAEFLRGVGLLACGHSDCEFLVSVRALYGTFHGFGMAGRVL
jgi:hypothetical protein